MADNESYFESKITKKRISPATLVADEIAYLKSRAESGDSNITDVNVGSEVRNLLEAMAMTQYQYMYDLDQLGMMLFLKYATGGWLDDIAWQYGLTRKQGSNASGNVLFEIKTPMPDDYVIDAGTVVLNRRNGLEYVLNSQAIIPKNQLSTTGIVVALAPGSEYNCEVGDITAFSTENLIKEDLTVYNIQPFYNGRDVETDDEFRQRILKHIRGGSFGSIQHYKSLCENISGIHDVTFIAPELLNSIQQNRHTISENGVTLECNDCTGVCIINPDDKSDYKQELEQKVLKVLTNPSNIVFGHEFHTRKAYYSHLFFKINYYAEGNKTVSEEDVFLCLTKFFFGGTYEGDVKLTYQGYNIGDTVYKQDMIDALENMEGIHHVEQIYLLGWHNDLSGIKECEKYYRKAWEHSEKMNYTYKNILDYPDYDDNYPKEDAKHHYDPSFNPYCPYWSRITDANINIKEGQSIFQICIDGYYFYKIKDNNSARDGSTGEYPLNEKDVDFWQWGIKPFNKITVARDTVPVIDPLNKKQTKLDEINDGKDELNPHILWLNKLN